MNILPQPWIQTFGWTLVHSLWILTMVALALRLILRLLPALASRLRYAVAVGSFLLAFCCLLYTGYRVHQPEPSGAVSFTHPTQVSESKTASPPEKMSVTYLVDRVPILLRQL